MLICLFFLHQVYRSHRKPFYNCVCALEQKELRRFGDPIKTAGMEDRAVPRTHKGILPWRHTGLRAKAGSPHSHPGPRSRSCSPVLTCREMGRTINHKVHLRQSSKTKITGGNENKRIKASTQSSEIKVKVEAGSFKKHISNDQARKDKYETLPPVVETERLV